MKIPLDKIDVSGLAHLWSNDAGCVKKRRLEWNRIKGAYSGYTASEVTQLRKFMVDGLQSDLDINELLLLYFIPWETSADLLQIFSIFNRERIPYIWNHLICKRFVCNEDIREDDDCLMFSGTRADVLQKLLESAEFDYSFGTKMGGFLLPIDFADFCQWYEWYLYLILTSSEQPVNFFRFYESIYFGYIRYKIGEKEDISHDQKIRKLIAVASNYSPISRSGKTSRAKLLLAQSFASQLREGSNSDYFMNLYGSDFRNAKTFSFIDDIEKSELVRICDSNLRSFMPRFLIDVDIEKLVNDLAVAVAEFGASADVKVIDYGTVDLSPELTPNGAESLGLTINGQIPTKKWVLSIAVNYNLVSQVNGSFISDCRDLVWLDIYAVLSDKVKKCDFGKVTGIGCIRYSSVFKNNYLDEVTSNLCQALELALIHLSGDRFRYLVNSKKSKDQCLYFKNPPMVFGGFDDILKLNLDGFTERAL